MGHNIQVIVAPAPTADVFWLEWPELARLDVAFGFCLFPVTAELIDDRLAPDETPTSAGEEFTLLTGGFRELLWTLSSGGQLAYVETDYFGGVGGQGALVCGDGVEIMPPVWANYGPIEEALREIGFPSSPGMDRFDGIGFGEVRSNEDLFERLHSKTDDSAR